MTLFPRAGHGEDPAIHDRSCGSVVIDSTWQMLQPMLSKSV